MRKPTMLCLILAASVWNGGFISLKSSCWNLAGFGLGSTVIWRHLSDPLCPFVCEFVLGGLQEELTQQAEANAPESCTPCSCLQSVGRAGWARLCPSREHRGTLHRWRLNSQGAEQGKGITKNSKESEVKTHLQFTLRDLCPHPAQREWDEDIPPQRERQERWRVAWPQGRSAVDLGRIYLIFKVFKRGWRYKDFYGGLLPSHFEIILACWALGGRRCCRSLRDFPEHGRFTGVLWLRGEKRAVLLLYAFGFLQRLFVVGSHKAVNNWPSLFL